jgi:hypothetical protein
MQLLRLALAGIFATVLAVFLGIALYSDALNFLSDGVRYIVFFGFILASGVWFLFLLRNSPAGPRGPTGAEMEAAGMLLAESYRARRAVRIDESEDEGFHFLLELEDGRVLLLTGQYLYYLCDDLGNGSTFPSTAFTLKRHKHEGYAWSLQPTGNYLKPEREFPADRALLLYKKWNAGDGAILPLTFDEAFRELDNFRS